MKHSKITNMTQGHPAALLALFALPMLAGNILQQAYNLVDSIIVGRFVGASALAAVGATGSVSFLFFSVCSGISSGCGIVTSQYFGSGDQSGTKRAIANSAYIMFAASLIMSIAAYAATPWTLRVMSTPEEILSDAVVYMRMGCIGVPLVAIYNYSTAMLHALGDSKTPLAFLAVACVLNIVLDYVCVCSFQMGVFGAALATLIAQVIAGIGCLAYALKRNPYFMLQRSECVFDAGIAGRAIRIGLPLAMQWSMIAVSTTALQTFVNSFGTAAVAAFTATSRVEQLVHQPYNSLSAALSTYAGQNYGARKLDRVKDGLKQAMLMSAGFSLLMLVVNQAFSRQIMTMFVDEADVISIGASALRLTSWFYIFLALIYMTRGLLNGIGDALFAFINGIVEMIGRICLPMLLALIPGVGLWGIWWTAGLTWCISAVFCYMRYAAWRNAEVIK